MCLNLIKSVSYIVSFGIASKKRHTCDTLPFGCLADAVQMDIAFFFAQADQAVAFQ